MNISSISNFDLNDEKPEYCVYAHICKAQGPDYGRTYIGVTNNIKTRWRLNGGDYRPTTELYKAFQRYGWNNFSHIVIIENITVTMADTIERQLIKKYNTNYRNGGFGYNANNGGISYRKPFKEIYQYDVNGVYIQSFDDIDIAADVVGCKRNNILGCLNSSHYTANYLWNTEYVDSMPEYIYNKNYRKYANKPILKISIDGKILNRYNDVYEIAESNNGNIIKSCNGEYAISDGFIWVYEINYSFDDILYRQSKYNEFINNIKKNRNNVYSKNISAKEIDLYDLDSNYIKTFKNIQEVQDSLKIQRINIINSCDNPGVNVGNYLFAYHNDPIPKMNNKYIAIKEDDDSVVYKFKTKEQIINFIQKPSKYSRINEVCRGERKTAYGYIWRYLDDSENIIEPAIIKRK